MRKIIRNRRIKLGLTSIILGGFLIGCAAPAQNTNQEKKKENRELTDAQKKVIAGEVLAHTSKNPYLKLGGVLYSSVSQMEHDLDVANAGKSEVNVYENQGQSRSPNGDNSVRWLGGNTYVPKKGFKWTDTKTQEARHYVEESGGYMTQEAWVQLQKRKKGIEDYNFIMKKSTEEKRKEALEPTPKGLFSYNKFIDLDGNGIASGDEFFGLEKTKFDLDEESLHVSFYFQGDYSQYITLRSWTAEGELIGTTTQFVLKNNLFSNYTGLNSNGANKDYLDLLSMHAGEHGPGKYVITANANKEQTHKIEIEITN